MQSLDWVYNAYLSLLTVNRPMHLRYRKLKTCKLVCMQTMGIGGSEGIEGHHHSLVYIIKGLS